MAGSMAKAVRLGFCAAHALALVVLGAAAAETAPLADRARAVLEAHCTPCREDQASAVDLGVLAEDPSLIVPRRPDASRAYQQLIREARATPAEIETVRDWIESLPARDAGCRGRSVVTAREVDALINRWVDELEPAEAVDTRVLSLVHLWNACATPERIKEARDATATLLGALARRRDPIRIETLGEESALVAVRLGEIAVLPAEWERLTATAPKAASRATVPADWLAARIVSHPKDALGNVDPAFDVKFDAAGLRGVEHLAASWNRDVDLVRAAAERGMTPRALATALDAVGGEFLHPARRLMYGALSRAAWESLSRALDGEARPGSADKSAPASDSEIDVLLWTDKPFYAPRDLVAIGVSVSRACHLTLIDVDRDGKAVVLFPNELDQDNLVAPGVDVRIPGKDAGYQFRFEKSGEEQIVAICRRKERNPDGISYNYEKQRFESLGDWRAFLRTTAEREKEIGARADADSARRRRRGRTTAGTEGRAIGADDPVSAEGRAAVTVTIDRGGGPKH